MKLSGFNVQKRIAVMLKQNLEYSPALEAIATHCKLFKEYEATLARKLEPAAQKLEKVPLEKKNGE